MAAPTLATTPDFQAAVTRDLSTLVTGSFTPANGEVLVAKVASEDQSCVPGTPTGGSLTWTVRASASAALNANAAIYTAVVGVSPGAMTVSAPWTGTGKHHSLVLERWTGAQLAGTPATNATQRGTGAPSTTLTSTGTDSIVTWVDADWNAVAPGTPAYLSSATQDGLDDWSTAFYVAYHAWQAAAVAGTQTMGQSAPTGQKWSLVGIEVQSSSPTVAPFVPQVLVVPSLAAVQAGSW